jgi:hypothetical protein
VEGPDCNFEEAQGFLSKTAKVRRCLTGGVGSGRWIAIQRRRRLKGEGGAVDRAHTGLTRGRIDLGRGLGDRRPRC